MLLATTACEDGIGPEETLAVARSIPGCEVTIMKGLGHFPMSENPAEFSKYLLPVLEQIATMETWPAKRSRSAG